jgi:hypothetical protein
MSARLAQYGMSAACWKTKFDGHLTFNEAKKTAGLTLVKMLVTGLVLALLAGTIVKIKLFGGPQ